MSVADGWLIYHTIKLNKQSGMQTMQADGECQKHLKYNLYLFSKSAWPIHTQYTSPLVDQGYRSGVLLYLHRSRYNLFFNHGFLAKSDGWCQKPMFSRCKKQIDQAGQQRNPSIPKILTRPGRQLGPSICREKGRANDQIVANMSISGLHVAYS